MQKLTLLLMVAVALFALTIAVGCSEATGEGFSADLVIQQPKESITIKLYVMGDYYRVENLEEKMLAIEIPGDTTLAMNPEEKTFKAIDGPAGAFVNPVKGWEYMRRQLVESPAGRETVEGYECEKFVYSFEGQTDTTLVVWKSPELNHFVKMLVHYPEGDGTMTLTNIEVGPQATSLFNVPDDYTREKTPDEIEAARTAITGEATATAPVARRLAAGGKLRVAVDPSSSDRIKVESLVKQPCVATVSAFSGGQPAMDEPIPVRLEYKGERKEPFFGLQNNADEILIEVDSGRVMVTVLNEYSSFDENRTTEYFVYRKGRGIAASAGKKLQFTLTGDSQDAAQSTGIVEVFSQYWEENGQVRKTVEKIELNLRNGESLTREYTPDQTVDYLMIDIDEGGGVQLVVSQPRK
jgi:hypothetical protein